LFNNFFLDYAYSENHPAFLKEKLLVEMAINYTEIVLKPHMKQFQRFPHFSALANELGKIGWSKSRHDVDAQNQINAQALEEVRKIIAHLEGRTSSMFNDFNAKFDEVEYAEMPSEDLIEDFEVIFSRVYSTVHIVLAYLCTYLYSN